MDDENILDLNFWPAFSDLMLSLVLILILVLFLVAAVLNVGTVNLSHVEKNQEQLIHKIATVFDTNAVEIKKNRFGITGPGNGSQSNSGYNSKNMNYDVIIKNEPTVQKYTFSRNILFESDKTELKTEGREILNIVGEVLKANIANIREIQIQGHADTNTTYSYKSNVHLAALRAITVFNFLNKEIGIDPAKHLMSITSFGEFKPVQRSEDDRDFNKQKLDENNLTYELRGENRRIELLIFYYF